MRYNFKPFQEYTLEQFFATFFIFIKKSPLNLVLFGLAVTSRHVPEKQLADRMKELEKFKNKPVIVSCASGRRAATVAGSLRKQGFTDIVALRGGIAAWQQAGMPLEK